MLGLKNWVILVIVLNSLSYGFVPKFSPCFPAVKEKSCNMSCITQDFSQQISIYCNGSSVGSCGLGCSPNMFQEGTNHTYYQINTLLYDTHLCNWSCSYGTTFSNDEPFEIYSDFYKEVTIKADNNANNAQLEGTAKCLHPSNPTVKVQYRYQESGSYQNLTNQPVSLRSSHVPGDLCTSSLENRITAISEVSGGRIEMIGKTVFFKMIFIQSPTTLSMATNDSKAISFEGCGTDGELFMCGFSLFLIELAVFIVIMILLKLEKMGGFTKLKIVVSCVFLLVALIIGIILGVVLMECSKKNLSLGLGIGLGCMLASAHFVTINVIHNKNDSKKDDKDKERQGKASSHGNPASKNGNVIVSLPNEPIRPLPVPPATRKNQLEPLSVENDGATSPEKKKKKKKKKKRKNTESTDAPEES